MVGAKYSWQSWARRAIQAERKGEVNIILGEAKKGRMEGRGARMGSVREWGGGGGGGREKKREMAGF